MLKIRKSDARGHVDHGWLNAYHSFSFAEYVDPAHMQYSVLRVINEDRIAGGSGFGMHPHRNMEIVTYIIEGALKHEDSMGNTSVIRTGDVQRMTAGSGVRHSEFNASADTTVHLLQIWILPEQNGLMPSYEEKHFNDVQKEDQWCLLVSPDGHDDSLTIYQDINIYDTKLSAQHDLPIALASGRCAYLQVVKGDVVVAGYQLSAGDALMIEDEVALTILAQQDAQLLLFDLPVLAE